MKMLLVGFLLLTGHALADNTTVTIQNFSFEYKNPHGAGSATSFSHDSFSDQSVGVAVDRIDKDFNLMITGAQTHELQFKDAPATLTDAETMTVTGLNLNLAHQLSFSLQSGRFNSPKDQVKVDGLFLNCSRDSAHESIGDQLISGCGQQMSLKIAKYSSVSSKEMLSNVLESHELLSDLGMSTLDLKVTSGKYNLSADVKAQISGKIKSNGNISYNATTGLLTVKIVEVKFGFLNITGKVFDELKKQESDVLKVKEPYVYYSIK